MDFEFRHLQHVKTLAEQRSFAKAARRLGISQPALSRSVQELERRLGLALFTRGREGVEATDVGRVLLQRGEELLASAGDLDRHMRLLRGLEIGTLRVGAGIYPSEMFVAHAVARMVREHPGVAVEVRTRNPEEHFAALRRHEIDVAVVEAPWAGKQQDFEVTTLAWHRGYCAVRGDHPLCSVAVLSWRDALRYPVAMSARIPPEILSEFRQAAAEPEQLRFVGCDSPSMMKTVALRSDAVAILPSCVMAAEIASGSLVALALTAPWLGRAFGIVRLANRSPSPAEEVFSRFLADADREAAAGAPAGSAALAKKPPSRRPRSPAGKMSA